MAGWLDKYQEGGEVFLQPNSKKLPKGYKVPLKDESSELAMSIGGEQGEPAYLIPSFKYGKPLLNPLEEYRETGEHLGGPFKTWQEADKWEREIRHPYVEKGQPIPSPLKYWGEGFKNGGIIAQGGETIPLSREIPEITVYGKKKYLQELDKQQQKYLADMAKYKQDSAAYQSYQDSLNLYTGVLDMANNEQSTYWNTRKKEIIDNYKRTAKGETVEYWKKAKAESKDVDKSWYDQMIKKSIDEQKYYSDPKNIDKSIQEETRKNTNAFNLGTAYQLKTATNKNSNRFDYPDDGYFYTNMIRANNSSDREYKDYLNYFIKDRESELATAIKSGKNQVSVSGMASTNIPGAKSEISNAKRLKKLLSSDIKPIGYTDSPESLRYPIYKKPVVEPPIATKPIRTNVKYDSTYENLQMRPLWATMAKQDTTSKIGTLNPLDPLYEKGFTYGEAQKFPEEIRKQYKLDYPIYESGGVITKAENGEQISREDYLRQQHQNYLKSQAEKGRKAVVEGREKFNKDYVIPAIKTAGSFTPAGLPIGLMDAYKAYQEGNTGWAVAGAAAEALPYVGKVISKPVIKITKDVTKALKHNSPSDLLKYNKFAFKLEDIPRSIEEIKELNKIKDRIKNASTTDLIDWKKSRMLSKSAPDYDNTYNKFQQDLSKAVIDIDNHGASPSSIILDREEAYLNFDDLHPSNFTYKRKIKNPKVNIIDNINESNVNGVRQDRFVNIGLNLTDKPASPFETGTTLNHELDHYVSFPTVEDYNAMEKFLNLNKSHNYYTGITEFDSGSLEYLPFYNKSGTEIKARLGQIKDLLGVTGNTQITKPQIRAALKVINNQSKYGLSNNMLDISPVAVDRNNSLSNIYSPHIPFFRRVEDKNKMLQYMNDATSSPVFTAYKQGGIIPKAQEGKKVKKSVIFAESPKIEEGQPQYYIYDYHSQLPPSLNNLREKYKDLRERSDELYSTTVSLRNYLINYLKGYTGKDVYSVNSDNTYSALDDDGYERVYSTEEFKDLPRLKKYNELEKEFYENYYPPLMALEKEFRDHPDNTTSERVSDVFQVEGNKLREWYKKKGEELSVIPIYGIQDTSKVNAALKDVDLQDVGIMGHSGGILGGIPLKWWNNKLKDAEYRNCILGTCLGEGLVPLLPDVKNIYHTTENQWYGVNPSADSLENALFSTHKETKIKPIKGRDYNISNKYKTGGNVSYTPEYIEQLKRFENRPDNLAYHLDNKKIPTIGWGHKITEEELKRKAIKMGKEWVPYERFSGKEGRILADKLMEADVAHHYARLERQVGKDTLDTLPPEVQDVLLDITYNRGSLGDSLEYVKKGDIPGLKDYLASIANNRRTKWRADRIPVKTLPPVERPIEYNTKDQYVPEVLRSIAEQPSTQSIIPIQDNEGYRNQENYGKPVQITSNQSTTPISMQDVPFPILAMSDTGELKIMMPGEEHEFEGGSVTELPMAQQGDIIKSNQLRTFTKDSGWLNKYKEL